MTKILKRITVIFAAICLMTAAVFASACNPDGNPAEMGYEITVLYPDGTPVKKTDSGSARNKVNVVLTDSEGKALNSESMGELDDYGTAHIDYKVPGEYTINVNNVPAAFRYVPEKTSPDKAKQTVRLQNLKTTYEITVLTPDGSPASGYSVEVEYPENEIKGTTNAQGKFVTPEINAGTYPIKVSESSGEIHHKGVLTSPASDKVTVNTFKPTVITPDKAHEMTDAQLEDWLSMNSYNSDGTPLLTYISEFNDNYLFTAEASGTEERFYILHATEAGNYTFTLRPDVNVGTNNRSGNYLIRFYRPDSYDDYDDSLTLNGNTNSGTIQSNPLAMKAGENWIFSVSSIDGRDHYSVNMAVAFSKEPQTVAATGEGDFTLIYNDNDEAILEFMANRPGKYEITLKGGHPNSPKYLAYSDATKKPFDDVDANEPLYGQAHDFPITANYAETYFTKDDKGNLSSVGSQRLVYHIFINTRTDSTVSLNIKWVDKADPLEDKVPEEEVPVPSNLTKQELGSDYETYTYAWHWLDTDGTQDPVYEDGKWIVDIGGTKYDVYVAISKNFAGQEYSFETVEYYGNSETRPGASQDDGSGSAPSDGDETSGSVQTERQNNKLLIKDGDKAYNYRKFVAEYVKLASKATAPVKGQGESDADYNSKLQAFNSFAEATDGVYALNDGLKTLCERFMANQWYNLVENANPSAPPARPWLIACGYFTKTAIN